MSMPGRRVRTTEVEATPWGVYTAVLLGVVILMAVGMAGVLSLGADGGGPNAPGRSPPPSTRRSSPTRRIPVRSAARPPRRHRGRRPPDRERVGAALEHPEDPQRGPLPCLTRRHGISRSMMGSRSSWRPSMGRTSGVSRRMRVPRRMRARCRRPHGHQTGRESCSAKPTPRSSSTSIPAVSPASSVSVDRSGIPISALTVEPSCTRRSATGRSC